MGKYLNPGNNKFKTVLNSKYVDKTGLIEFVNHHLNGMNKLLCVSRPRRFGKSYAAKMLAAYYDNSCDSHDLFDSLEISQTADYRKHLNKYNVIYIDVTDFTTKVSSVGRGADINSIVKNIQGAVIADLKPVFPNAVSGEEDYLQDVIANISLQYHTKFLFIIDEWDAIFREFKENEEIQKDYINMLRGLFKTSMTDDSIAGAYITGILPIKKYNTQSAMTDFREFTMLRPRQLAKYVGFTEEEVKKLCEENNADFHEMEKWYDGYSFHEGNHIYSPNSVMEAINNEEFGNYWTGTEAYKPLRDYISMNFDELRDDVIRLLAGERVYVDPLGFQNDMVNVFDKDDVLTLLIHLGYLAYDSATGKTRIPNLEVRDSFRQAVKDSSWKEVGQAIRDSDRLLDDTIAGNTENVAHALELIHESTSSVLAYNDENSLSCALTIAYYTARRYYNIVREFPTGKGFADLAFIPYPGTSSSRSMPAMIIELKYDESADSAIRQIKEKRYEGAFSNGRYADKLLLVGISYDRKTKSHSCMIEKM